MSSVTCFNKKCNEFLRFCYTFYDEFLLCCYTFYDEFLRACGLSGILIYFSVEKMELDVRASMCEKD